MLNYYNLGDPLLATFADPFIQYSKAFILHQARHNQLNTTLTLREKALLKTPGWEWMILFRKYDIYTIDKKDDLTPNKIEQKKNLVWLLSHPPPKISRPTIFWFREDRKQRNGGDRQ